MRLFYYKSRVLPKILRRDFYFDDVETCFMEIANYNSNKLLLSRYDSGDLYIKEKELLKIKNQVSNIDTALEHLHYTEALIMREYVERGFDLKSREDIRVWDDLQEKYGISNEILLDVLKDFVVEIGMAGTRLRAR